MRRFIYLDTDTLNSYISQIEKGLIIDITEENEDNNNTTKTNSQQFDLEGSADFKILGKGIGATASGNLNHEKQKSESSSKKNTVNKQQFDNIFDRFLKYVETEKILKDKATIENIGDFIKINSNLTIIDLQYYIDLFSNNGFIEFVKKQELATKQKLLDDEYKALNRDNQRSQKTKEELNKLKKEISTQLDNTYNSIKDTFQVLMSLIPYNKLIFTGDFIVPIDDGFLRDNPKIVANKYGGDIKILGYITNEIKNSNDTENAGEEQNIFESFPGVINSFLLVMLKRDELKIVHPIAIYY